MVFLMVIAAERHADRVGLVLGGCRRDGLRRAAVRVCAERFGTGEWHVSDETYRPAMRGRNGSVRLWEGRFELTRS